ncbi:MAG: DUF2238 domain-containing protein [Planctomycetota bacterium]
MKSRGRRDGGIDRRVAWGAFALVVAILPVSCLNAPFPEPLVLQHMPTIAMLVGLAGCIHWRWLRTSSVLACLGFVVLHILGARWIYSYVPYDEWTRLLFGFSLSDSMGWERNHYDRFVHFFSGVFLVWPAAELLMRYGGMTRRGAIVQSVAIVLAIGAVYEVAEWQLAVWMSPEAAEAYNGQQGDMWDPQCDIALAGLGAVIMACVLLPFGSGNERPAMKAPPSIDQ